MSLSESAALRILERHLGATYHARPRGPVVVGIGDDCAVLSTSSRPLVWTTDACSEDVHFKMDWMSPAAIAHKSFHAALSDVPAMGAKPLALSCQLTLSPRVSAAFLEEFARTQAALCKEHRVPLVGGNITSGQKMSVVLSVLGQLLAEPLLRSGARPGDEVWLAGDVGLARAGYLLLEQGRKASQQPAEQACLRAFRQPSAEFAWGARLVGRASACMDISDGLMRDAQNLSSASGVSIVLDAERLKETLSPLLVACADRLRVDPLSTAVVGGEDYSLLATGDKARRPRGISVIGHVEKGSGAYLKCADALQADALARSLGMKKAGELRGGERKTSTRVVLSGGFEHQAK